MKTGIFLFSHTGHTRQLGEVIQQELVDIGHHVNLITLETQRPL